MRRTLLTLLLSIGYLYADCPDAQYLPSGYTTALQLKMRQIGSYLEKQGIHPQDLRFFEPPGTSKSEIWLRNLKYSDVESIIALTREREKDMLLF